MKNPITYIRHSLSTRIGLMIMFSAVVVFVVSLGFLYVKSRNYVREDAMHRASTVLNNTTLRVTEILNEVEIATNNTDWLVRTHLQPDSIRMYSRRIIETNSNFNGCSISFEPYFFPEEGKYFSVYSSWSGDTIETEQEGSDEYCYFEKEWYTVPKRQNVACWVDPFFDDYEDDGEHHEMITSYAIPLINEGGQCIGVISTDLSLEWLSTTISAQMPSQRSYCIMVSRDGTYFVHPDQEKLVNQTIFSNTDPDYDADKIALGNAMVRGEDGIKRLVLDDEVCYVFYRQLPQTGWSMAIVYPEDEIFRGYNNLYYIVLAVIGVGLLLLLILCRQIINNAIKPVNQLAIQARYIAAGNFDERIPRSDRIDPVGRLQNMFSDMQQYISGYINDIHRMNDEIEQRNGELIVANQQAQKALEKKIAFMQDLTHQVRTPLNIIIGFSQVLRMGCQDIPDEEMATIMDAMQENTKNLRGIVDKLLVAALFENKEGVKKDSNVYCNAVCRQVMGETHSKNPGVVTLHFTTSVPDDFTIFSNKNVIAKVLQQMLDNANQFTKQGTITLDCQQLSPETVSFIVSDTGIGIDEADAERVFEQFTKLDYYSEGLGLGLTLCRYSAEGMGGTFTLDMTYKEGARFVMTLPIA